MTQVRGNSLVYAAYSIAAFCAVVGMSFGYCGLNAKPQNRRKKRKSISPRVSKDIQKLLKSLPAKDELAMLINICEQSLRKGEFASPEVKKLRTLILVIADLESQKPYSMSLSMDCVEWLCSYHAMYNEVLLSVAKRALTDPGDDPNTPPEFGYIPREILGAIEFHRQENSAEMLKMCFILERSDIEQKDKIRNCLLRLSILSSLKNYPGIEKAYDDMLSVPGYNASKISIEVIDSSTENKQQNDEKDELDSDNDPTEGKQNPKNEPGGVSHVPVNDLSMSQLINAFLTAPLIGRWNDFLTFGDKLFSDAEANPMSQIEMVFQRSPQTRMLYRNLSAAKDKLPIDFPDTTKLFQGICDVKNIRVKLISFETNDEDLKAQFELNMNIWRPKELKNPRIIIEGATCYITDLLDSETSFSGSYTPNKIICCENSTIMQQILEIKCESEQRWVGLTTSKSLKTLSDNTKFEFTREIELEISPKPLPESTMEFV